MCESCAILSIALVGLGKSMWHAPDMFKNRNDLISFSKYWHLLCANTLLGAGCGQMPVK